MKYKYSIRAIKLGNTTFSSIDQSKDWKSAIFRAENHLRTGKYAKITIERTEVVKTLIWTKESTLKE